MSTQKPLSTLANELLVYIQRTNNSHLIYNEKLLDIHQGQLQKYVLESLQKELSPRAFERTKQRIAPINILTKVISKLSTVYTEAPKRSLMVDNTTDKELLEFYEDEYRLNDKLAMGNELYNLHKYFAIEPYLDKKGNPDLRIIPATKFLVWSDDSYDDTNPTVFIKFMGSTPKEVPSVDNSGNIKKAAETTVIDVPLFHVYSATEFMILDATGEIHEVVPNPYGRIPFVYATSSEFSLLPMPDADTFSMVTLIPKLLTDINYATQFQSHSIIYGIDIDPQDLDSNPDSFWVINSIPGQDKTPSIGTISPTVDSEKVISLINTEVAMWIDSKGLKVSSIGSATLENAASGVAKMIDESDTTIVRKKQTTKFSVIEDDLWDLTKIMHNVWVTGRMVTKQSKAFSDNFEVRVDFVEQKPVVDTNKVLQDIQLMMELGLATKEDALLMLKPDSTEEEIETKLLKIQEEVNKTNTITIL